MYITISSNCLSVDSAIIFFMSFLCIVLILAINIVNIVDNIKIDCIGGE